MKFNDPQDQCRNQFAKFMFFRTEPWPLAL